MKKISLSILVVVALVAGGFIYFRQQVYYSHGETGKQITFKVEKGDSGSKVASELKEAGLISGKIYFQYYLQTRGLLGKILPGNYELNSKMSIPEIATIITSVKDEKIVITFPEGWDSQQMAERLTEKGLDGDGFLRIVKDPTGLAQEFSFLQNRQSKSLEGYLFPDTYYFSEKSSAESIVKRMLLNFEEKLTNEMKEDIEKAEKSLEEEIIMASVIEGEVRSSTDRKVVSGIFWDRIKIGQPLQSCATLAFILGENKKQYSFQDTRVESPYNTYLNKGLPPSPINNPGLEAIEAAIYPTFTDYSFFLSDPKTGETIFSKTLDEHNLNKVKHGL